MLLLCSTALVSTAAVCNVCCVAQTSQFASEFIRRRDLFGGAAANDFKKIASRKKKGV